MAIFENLTVSDVVALLIIAALVVVVVSAFSGFRPWRRG
jgi:hypothetical protein